MIWLQPSPCDGSLPAAKRLLNRYSSWVMSLSGTVSRYNETINLYSRKFQFSRQYAKIKRESPKHMKTVTHCFQHPSCRWWSCSHFRFKVIKYGIMLYQQDSIQNLSLAISHIIHIIFRFLQACFFLPFLFDADSSRVSGVSDHLD